MPWGQRVLLTGLFREQDPARFFAALDGSGIDYLLVPNWEPAAEFDGSNYPRSFLDCVDSLAVRGRLRMLWQSHWLTLMARVRTQPSGPSTP